jgi:hypothetical protein
MARAVEHEPAALPLLSFTCSALWERRDEMVARHGQARADALVVAGAVLAPLMRAAAAAGPQPVAHALMYSWGRRATSEGPPAIHDAWGGVEPVCCALDIGHVDRYLPHGTVLNEVDERMESFEQEQWKVDRHPEMSDEQRERLIAMLRANAASAWARVKAFMRYVRSGRVDAPATAAPPSKHIDGPASPPAADSYPHSTSSVVAAAPVPLTAAELAQVDPLEKYGMPPDVPAIVNAGVVVAVATETIPPVQPTDVTVPVPPVVQVGLAAEPWLVRNCTTDPNDGVDPTPMAWVAFTRIAVVPPVCRSSTAVPSLVSIRPVVAALIVVAIV